MGLAEAGRGRDRADMSLHRAGMGQERLDGPSRGW